MNMMDSLVSYHLTLKIVDFSKVFVGLIPWIAIISWVIKLEIDKVGVSTSINSYSWVSIYCYKVVQHCFVTCFVI